MISKAKRRIVSITEVLHLRIFGHEMSEEMRNFLSHLSWSFSGGIVAAVIMFSINIFAGRLLGPSSYGNYNYLLSLAASSVLIFLLGNNTSAVRFISDNNHYSKKNSILTAGLSLTFFQVFLFLIFIIIFGGKISSYFDIDQNILYLIFFFGLILSFKELLDSFLRALNLIKKQSIIKAADAIIVAIVFISLLAYFKNTFSYFDYIYAFMAGSIFFSIVSFYLIRKYIVRFNLSHIFLILNYNKFIIIGAIGGLIISLDKVFIGKYIGNEKLGLYSAYFTSSQLIISNLAIIFMNIFWPAVIKNKNSLHAVADKLDMIFFRFFPVWFLLNILSMTFFMMLFGKQYPIHILYLVLFSLSSLLSVIFSIFVSLLNVDKVRNSVLITTCAYLLMVSSIIIFKDITIYLIFQIIIYMVCVIYIRNEFKLKKYE